MLKLKLENLKKFECHSLARDVNKIKTIHDMKMK